MFQICETCTNVTNGRVKPCILEFDMSDASELPEGCPLNPDRPAVWKDLEETREQTKAQLRMAVRNHLGQWDDTDDFGPSERLLARCLQEIK